MYFINILRRHWKTLQEFWGYSEESLNELFKEFSKNVNILSVSSFSLEFFYIKKGFAAAKIANFLK